MQASRSIQSEVVIELDKLILKAPELRKAPRVITASTCDLDVLDESFEDGRRNEISCNESSTRLALTTQSVNFESDDALCARDLRQTRLFRTRFCSYGDKCPYWARGRCLYAHTQSEIRTRPPPPPQYTCAGPSRAMTECSSWLNVSQTVKINLERMTAAHHQEKSILADDSLWILPDTAGSLFRSCSSCTLWRINHQVKILRLTILSITSKRLVCGILINYFVHNAFRNRRFLHL